MARHSIAQVVNNQLQRRDSGGNEIPPIPVGSKDWYAWLSDQEALSFAYKTAQGTMTARRELRHGSWYWYAYRCQNARLRKVYLGKTENLTPQRLNDAIQELVNHHLLPGSTLAVRDNPPPAAALTLSAGLLKTKLAIP